MDVFRKLAERFRSAGFWPTVKYLFFTVLLERLGVHVSAVFEYPQDGATTLASVSFRYEVIDASEALTPAVRDALFDYGGDDMLADFEKSFSQGQLAVLGYDDDMFGCVCWFQQQKHGLFGADPVFLIWRCFTLPQMRGRRLYPQSLVAACSHIRQALSSDMPIVVESSIFNTASVRGIEKAGFKRISRKIEIGKWGRFF